MFRGRGERKLTSTDVCVCVCVSVCVCERERERERESESAFWTSRLVNKYMKWNLEYPNGLDNYFQYDDIVCNQREKFVFI